MALLLAYSTTGITCGEKVSHDLKMAAILKMSKYIPQLKVRTKLYIREKSIFHDDDVIDGVKGWPGSWPLYSCLG